MENKIERVEQILEYMLGVSIEQIDRMDLEEIEKLRFKRTGVKLKFPKYLLPWEVDDIFYIGRIESPEEIEMEITKLIKKYLK